VYDINIAEELLKEEGWRW